jgi:hypothetical protein
VIIPPERGSRATAARSHRARDPCTPKILVHRRSLYTEDPCTPKTLYTDPMLPRVRPSSFRSPARTRRSEMVPRHVRHQEKQRKGKNRAKAPRSRDALPLSAEQRPSDRHSPSCAAEKRPCPRREASGMGCIIK